MGIGDEIIATGQAREEYERTGKRVLICDYKGAPRWSGVWENIPFIIHPNEPNKRDISTILNGARCRPYINYRKGFTRRIGLNYSGWSVRDHLGTMVLSESELAFGEQQSQTLGNFVIVEPNIPTPGSNPNKQWPIPKWQGLADLLNTKGLHPIQIGPRHLVHRLKNVPHILTPDFRMGVALMQRARWSFLPDGGLHHAAGVLKLPATVLWGGANDPNLLGYAHHENIYFPQACCKWMPCPHCQTIWNWLKPAYVFERTKRNPLWQK